MNRTYTVKKVNDFPLPRREITDQTLPWPGIIKFFPARESLVSDIQANPRQDLNKGVQMRFFLPIA
jgi:hypothetical protein